ncbi:protein translocase subunit SecD [Nesterenkonia sandarakina]|uniref:Protein translocase subunit SecD n=1 Tax=Nesterenkonia sandarakina TaxID=272918 RepID=A0A2T0YSJ0_9MICC|nr:protein translocase subunit SecD [Nesterenkonia sandarakina]PRZ18756.1 preprotein translocase subunit SecD [Nesterenkonia sandarakina]
MAPRTPVASARGALIALLVLLLGMGGLLAFAVQDGRAQWAPLLALDLEGGTQMVLSPQVEGGEEIDAEQLDQAVEIIRQRVDGSGVTESEIATQGAENVVVGMPGVPDQETRELIQASANMEFRPVLQVEQDLDFLQQTLLEDEDLTEEEAEALEEELAATEEEGDDEPAAQPEDFEEPTAEPENGSDPNWITPEVAADFANFTCSTEISLEERAEAADDEPLSACDPTSGVKYLLGPVEVPGTSIADSSFGMEQSPSGQSTGRWAVTINFDADGTEAFRDTTTRLVNLEPPRNQFAIMLDGQVISAPTTQAAIVDGRPQITGDFTEEEARGLSEQLRYGSLPISFEIESEQQISATLGDEQLRLGLLAGIIGLVLVAGYALFQYRALGLVTIASLVVAGVMTWWAIALLGWSDGYRLSLAGIAGLIVSIGLTADSFIVYFERIKDELREGRSLPGAVEAGWARARRTILASKAVNIIASVVLYLVAVGNVRGFAFTLGLTAIIDIILVFLFTHPLMQLIARRKFFAAGKRFSGLSEKELGVDVLYRGRGRFARSNVVSAGPAGPMTPRDSTADPGEEGPPSTPLPRSAISPDDAKQARIQELPEISELEWSRMTIAERRRARAEAARQRSSAPEVGESAADTETSDERTGSREAHSSRGTSTSRETEEDR